MASFASYLSLLLLSSFLLGSNLSLTSAQDTPPLVEGLSWDFYNSSCPALETIIREYLVEVFRTDIGQAAGLLRIHFHDCFVLGCDASVLLEGSASGPGSGEQQSIPNGSLRARGFAIINELRSRIDAGCGQVVSCSDVTALAARDSVYLSGGPDYALPLGRRDGINLLTPLETQVNLPSFNLTAGGLIDFLANKGLDTTDLVAISGGHTIGVGNCDSFAERLYPPTEDPNIEQTYARNLRSICTSGPDTAVGTTVLDIRSTYSFDNRYYIDLTNRQGLFISDQDLFTNTTTRPIVQSFANNQTLFFERFVFSIIKMGMMNVSTGTQGEIRANCSRVNPPPPATTLTTVVDEEEKRTAFWRR